MPRPPIQPRVYTRQEAAHYVGFRGARGKFPEWLRKWGVRPIPRDRDAFDVLDLDAGLDREKNAGSNDNREALPAPSWGIQW